MHDTWTDRPLGEGLALIGDAAGSSDPHIGQGLSIALRDVRMQRSRNAGYPAPPAQIRT